MSTPTKKFVLVHNFDSVSKLMSGELYPAEEKTHFGLNCRRTESIDAKIVYRIVWADGISEIKTSNHRFHLGNLINMGSTVSHRALNFMLECRVEIKTTATLRDSFLNNDKHLFLNVGGATIYVPKMLLDAQFKKFQSEISKDPDNSVQFSTEDFMDFLFTVEGYRVLNDKNVVSILSIAKTYGSDTVVELCEQFLMHESIKPPSELIRIAEEFNLDSLRSSVVNPNSRELVISVDYEKSFSSNLFRGREEFHSNFYWRIQIRNKKHTVSYGLECRPIGKWSNQFSLTARIEPCVIFETKNVKSNVSSFQFDGSNQIFWNHVYKPASPLRVKFKVEITKVVGFGIVTNAFQCTNEAVLLIVEGKKFKFPKVFLTSHFKYFQSTLSEISEEIVIEASLHDFENLLSVLDGINVIDEENVVAIVRLAHKYGVEIVIKKCEQFLIEDSKRSPEHLTEIAEEFNLGLLKRLLKPPQINDKIMECLECPICYRTYKDIPRILHCGHTFCFECLNQLTNLKCPFCCKAFARGSATQNYALMNVIEAVSPKSTDRSDRARNKYEQCRWKKIGVLVLYFINFSVFLMLLVKAINN
ncbi:hypothetical protein CAEBREN_14529 [Caenorhabditis brenneri]|uniref:RING-type domain-containing protein n=1 Tax=Caenorhabditis brenneri TaxID=135651 RepID=G0MD88_CAEBE|nr:hypothetical protein CAEBREN_14529 [Caenorhabditis brenneri]